MFHRLSSRGSLLTAVFKVCAPNPQKLAVAPCELHMPFLENFSGNSPMDMLCDNSDFRTANLYLQYLADYGIDHHSRSLVMNLPTLVNK